LAAGEGWEIANMIETTTWSHHWTKARSKVGPGGW
jgi:hypothetical protein